METFQKCVEAASCPTQLPARAVHVISLVPVIVSRHLVTELPGFIMVPNLP